MRKKTFIYTILALALTFLVACGGNDEVSPLSEDKLVVGVTGGPHEQIFEVIKEVAAKDGLEIEIKVFSDYVIPNTALDQGDLDANSYQHKPHMDKFNDDHGTKLASAFPTVLSAIGVYSEDLTDIYDVPEGGKIGIPNDPSNSARALIIFEEAGLIELDAENRETVTVLDITENERDLEFIELDAAQIPKLLGEVDLAVINGNFATENGLDPATDSLFTESSGSPYVNHLVVREENLNDPVIETLKKAYHSDEVKAFVNETFPGTYQTSW